MTRVLAASHHLFSSMTMISSFRRYFNPHRGWHHNMTIECDPYIQGNDTETKTPVRGLSAYYLIPHRGIPLGMRLCCSRRIRIGRRGDMGGLDGISGWIPRSSKFGVGAIGPMDIEAFRFFDMMMGLGSL
mmetsp:Transcript_12702/g.27038  ORF Transcript_12702/g.27038 Transcript_12702/m.27038 type:complete len:130 (-) Transcript_12702:71-460(-)